MKRKIPFVATIAHGYRFALENFLQIALIIAGPLLVQLIIGAYLLSWMIRLFQGMLVEDYSALNDFMLVIPAYLVGGILTFMQFTAVSELALGTHQPAPFGFPLGKPVWRLAGAFLLTILIVFLLIIAAMIVVFVLSAILGAAIAAISPEIGKAISAIAAGLGVLVMEGALIFVIFRLIFLLAPITLILERIDLRHAWRLTKGNFWRIFGIWMALLVPFVILEYALIFAAIGFPPVMPPDTAREAQQNAELAYNITMMQAIMTYWYVSLPVMVAGAAFLYGAIGGAQAFAYRALADEGSAPVAGD